MPEPLDQTKPFDVVIVGGGIIGCGIARDAARRGLTVALLEKNDFGSGTTAGSTRLIHGGLRYLATYDFGLVRLDLREREVLLRIAPHLVKPIPFLLPLPRGAFARLRLRIGMHLYDALSYDKSLPSHRILGREALAQAEPALDGSRFHGAALFYDAQCAFPERLAIENVVDAHAHGAVVQNYAEVVGAIRDGDRLVGVRVKHVLDGGREAEIRGRVVVNASGPWFDRVAGVLEPASPPRVRMTKGIHIACENVLASHALVLASAVDGRTVFAIPWNGYTWLGTTDTDFEGDPATATATDDDVRYLLDSVTPYLPALKTARKFWTCAGVRALVRAEGRASGVSRMHVIRTDRPGLVSIVGSKLTGYRAIAEEVVDDVCRTLGIDQPATTASAPLTSTAADGALPTGEDPLPRFAHAARHEWARRLEDVVLRRTGLGFSPDRGQAHLEAASLEMQRVLGWSSERRADEVARLLQTIRASVAPLRPRG